MTFSKSGWIKEYLGSGACGMIPVLAAPGIALTGLDAVKVYHSGALQAQCLEAVSKRWPGDMACMFMDLSLEAEAFGAPIQFSAVEAPCVSAPIAQEEEAIEALQVPEIGGRSLETLVCARTCAETLGRPLLAGILGPYSLAGRLADLTELMMMSLSEPELAHKLLVKVTDYLVDYAKALKNTGVAGLLIAEPAAGLVSPDMCEEFSSFYIRRMVDAVSDDSFLTILHNCGRCQQQVASMLGTGVDALHVGNAVKMTDILPQVPADKLVFGNIDPVAVLKYGSPEVVRTATQSLIQEMKAYPNFVLSSGCDIPFDVPMANLDAFFETWKQ